MSKKKTVVKEESILFEEVEQLHSKLKAQGETKLAADCAKVVEFWDFDSLYETPEYLRIYTLVMMYRTLGWFNA